MNAHRVAFALAFALAAGCKSKQPSQDTTITLPPQLTQAPPAPAFTPPRVVEIGRELLLNGDAEVGNGGAPCASGPGGRITGWAPDGIIGVAGYSTSADAPTDTTIAPPERGKCYFRASIGESDSVRSVTQNIPIAALSDSIDGDHVGFDLAAFVSSRTDGGTARMTVTFEDADGRPLASAGTPFDPVSTPTDKGLYLREVRGAVPLHARTARVTLSFLRNARGCATCPATAFADQLSFVLTHR